MDPDDFDELATRLDPAMIVVTVRHGDDRDGCLVGFHSQASIEPRRYGIWLSTANRTTRIAQRADALAVHLLGAEDHALAEWFGGTTGDEVDPFAEVETEEGPEGTVLVAALRSRFVGRVERAVETDGDHVLFVLAPTWVEVADEQPPLRLADADDIEPGHAAG